MQSPEITAMRSRELFTPEQVTRSHYIHEEKLDVSTIPEMKLGGGITHNREKNRKLKTCDILVGERESTSLQSNLFGEADVDSVEKGKVSFVPNVVPYIPVTSCQTAATSNIFSVKDLSKKRKGTPVNGIGEIQGFKFIEESIGLPGPEVKKSNHNGNLEIEQRILEIFDFDHIRKGVLVRSSDSVRCIVKERFKSRPDKCFEDYQLVDENKLIVHPSTLGYQLDYKQCHEIVPIKKREQSACLS